MFVSLILCTATVIVTMSIQVVAVIVMLRYLINTIDDHDPSTAGFGFEAYAISMVLMMLFIGHLIQIAIWAILFMLLGEFTIFETAFYHSTVNFASLGYGDIVMSVKWRLLGAIEASNGVLMFGLSAGTMLSVMTNLFARRDPKDT
jgi:hypothetical protein